MSERRKLIVVSNRGPISYDRGRRTGRERGAGGPRHRAGALVSHHDVTWIASAISTEDRAVAEEGTVDETARDGSSYRLRLVAHRPSAYDLYYNVIANPVLWFVQHGLWELKHDPEHDLRSAWEDGYVPVNRTFADGVVEELEREPDAAVLFHDYLYLAPALVREAAPAPALAHFTHIPWVAPTRGRCCRRDRARIHEGLLATDVTGFHTQRWRRAFLDSCRSLGLDPVERRVTAHPISIDPDEFESLARSEAVSRERELEADVRAADPPGRPHRPVEERPARTAGVRPPARAAARPAGPRRHARAARRLPPGHSRVRRGAPPDRGGRGRGRRRHPGALTFRVADDFPASIAAYKQFDVLLVNAVMDGLNLVAEAPVVNERPELLPYLSTQARSRSSALGRSGRSLRRLATADALEMRSRSARTSGAPPGGDPGARAAPRSRAWIAAQLADLDRE